MTETELSTLHQALLRGEASAPRALVNACIGPISLIVRRQYPSEPEEGIGDAVNDAILALIQHPERYDPKRGGLINYLVHMAGNKLKDGWRSRRRREREIAVGGSVELEQAEANHYREAGESGALGPPGTCLSSAAVAALVQGILPDPVDRQTWELICAGRTATEEYAVVMGITDLPLEEQRREVKRRRDRVQKRVQRRRDEFEKLLL